MQIENTLDKFDQYREWPPASGSLGAAVPGAPHNNPLQGEDHQTDQPSLQVTTLYLL